MTQRTNFDIGYSKLTINSLFKNTYIVPEYQREYVWETKEIDAFINDLMNACEENHEKAYFMGMIVVYSNGSTRYELIDGQQRITTFFLLISAIIHIYKENNQDAQVFEQRLRSVDMDENGKSFTSYSLELQYPESDGVLEKIYKNNIAWAEVEQLPDGSPKRLYSAYKNISLSLKNNYSDFNQLANFAVYIFNKTQMVQIESQDMSDALKIFETINQRGKGLNSLDLLKNMLFMQVPREDFKKLNTAWKDMMDKLQKVENKPLRFLRYFITSTYDITDKQTGVIKGILPEDSIYEWLSTNDSQCNYKNEPFEFMSYLSNGVSEYIKFLQLDPLDSGNDYLKNINRIAGTTYRSHIVLLLAANKMESNTLKHFKQLLEAIIYYATIDGIRGNETEKLFANWASKIRNIRNDDDLKEFIQSIVIPQVDKWNNEKNYKFRFTELNLNNIQKYRMKYVLARISKYVDEYRSNGKKYADLDANLASNIEIEHIMPQECPDFTQYGVTDGDEFNKYLMSIGNLTLLEKTQNSACKNKSYSEKKDFYQNSNIYLTKSIHGLSSVGVYNAATKMDEKLKCWAIWDKNSIEERANVLYNLSEEIWNIRNIVDTWK